MIKSLSEVYEAGIADERRRITERLKEEEKQLQQYGRTELWGLHKAMMIVNEHREEE